MKTGSLWNVSSNVHRKESRNECIDLKANRVIAQVLENRPVSTLAYRLDLSLPVTASGEIAPGQFFMVRTSTGHDPLLRRPFSVFSTNYVDGENRMHLALLYRIAGKGTRLMAEWSAGRLVDMVGPLGRGFRIREDVQTRILVAGGLGIASLFGLAESLLRMGKGSGILFYIGARTREEILMKPELESRGVRVEVTTEDGRMGRGGLVTTCFEADAPRLAGGGNASIDACGPFEMLVRTAKIARRYSLPCQVSLESRMACGLGACLGCPVKTRDRSYSMVCKDGPVFDADEIDWEGTGKLV
jgi:dihydroorotate dehydrogenase electron transfer subunit